MTKNQITYWMNQYTKQHYERSDAENERSHRANEALGYAQLSEAKRHNQATESLTAANIQLGYSQLAETQRFNSSMIQVQTMNAETNRMNAESNKMNAQTNRGTALVNMDLTRAKTEEITTLLPGKVDLQGADIKLRGAQTLNQQTGAIKNGVSAVKDSIYIFTPLIGG